MACFVYMFVSPLFQWSRICLLEIKKKKKNSDSVWCGCFQGKIKWQSCAEKAISQQNTSCDMQHVHGWHGVKCVCFPFAFPFVLRKDSAKNSHSCCYALLTCLLFLLLAQLRLLPWAELEETHVWWQVPGLEPCCVLAQVLPLESWKLPACSKYIWMDHIGVYFL